MKNKTLASITAAVIMTSAVLLNGCGNIVNAGSTGTEMTENTETRTAVTEDNNAAAAATAQTAETTADTDSAEAAENTADTDSAGENEQFTARDLAQTADLSEASYITVSDGEIVNITEEGVYVVSGSAKNASVVIKTAEEAKVQLVLDGVSIINTDQPCILVESADKVFVTSAEGSENVLTVSQDFSGDEDAVIFSQDDLVLNGLGTVTVTSQGDGIRTNDDLKLTGGTWIVDAADTALKAHNGIYASDGVYELTAGNDGLHAEDNDDDTAGDIVIEGGTFTVKVGDDGIHATTAATVNGGTLTITAGEGIEATQVIINDGSVNINASDDGINAGRKSTALDVKVEINGGTVTVAMGSGDTDAIDSNGDLLITGGTTDITGQSPFDCDGSCQHTGGTIIVNGTQTDDITNQMMGGQHGGQMGGQMGQFGKKRR